MSNSRMQLSSREDPVDPGINPGTGTSSRGEGTVSLNVYKPGFIDTTSIEDMKMALDRELGELSKAMFKTGENIETWQSESGDSLAKITEEINVLTEQGKALAERIITLTAQVGKNSASIEETQRVVAELDRVTAEKITKLEADLTLEGNRLEGLIQQEASIRLSADGAIGTRIDEMEVTFQSELAKTNASIRDESEVRANADEALAKRTTILEATMTGDLTNMFLNGFFEGGLQHGLDGYGIVRDASYTGGPPKPPFPNRLEISVRENLGRGIPVSPDDIYYVSLQCATIQTDAPVLKVGFKNYDASGKFISFTEVDSRQPSSTWFKLYGSYRVPAGVTYAQFCIILDYNNSNRYWHITNVVWNNITEQGGVYAAVKREELARVTADEAFAKVTEKLEADYKAADRDITLGLDEAKKEIVSAKAAINKEAEVRSNADEALAKTSERIEADYKKVTGDLQNGLNSANQKIVEANAAIQRESEARANADEALAKTSERIEAEYKSADKNLQGGINGANQGVTEAKAAIQRESEARASADESLARESSRIEAEYKSADKNLQGGINGANQGVTEAKAAITAEAEARANADGAMASRVDKVEASFNGQIASVKQYAEVNVGRLDGSISTETAQRLADQAVLEGKITKEEADRLIAQGIQDGKISNVEGAVGTLNAKWGVTVDANGKVAGIELNNGSKGSEFSIRADKFSFSDTSGNKSGGFSSSGGVTSFTGTVKSSNYVAGKSGWRITNEGDAEFETGKFRGIVYAGNMSGDLYFKRAVSKNQDFGRVKLGANVDVPLGTIQSSDFDRNLWISCPIGSFYTTLGGAIGLISGRFLIQAIFNGKVIGEAYGRNVSISAPLSSTDFTLEMPLVDCAITKNTTGTVSLKVWWMRDSGGGGSDLPSLKINAKLAVEAFRVDTSFS